MPHLPFMAAPMQTPNVDDGPRLGYILVAICGLILGPELPPDLMKYMPFRQQRPMSSARNRSRAASDAGAGRDDVTARSDALRMSLNDSPDGATSVVSAFRVIKRSGVSVIGRFQCKFSVYGAQTYYPTF